MKKFLLIFIISFSAVMPNGVFAQGITKYGEVTINPAESIDNNGEIGSGKSISMNGEIMNTPLTLSIGDAYQGGIIAYILLSSDTGYDSNIQHGLIAATSDQSIGTRWYNGSGITTGATLSGIGKGLDNTNTIISIQGSSISYAAIIAQAYRGGGYTDWYLPSQRELDILYLKIGKSAQSPNQNIGGFAASYYWSSTEYDINKANGQNFDNRFPIKSNKSSMYRVRAVRSF